MHLDSLSDQGGEGGYDEPTPEAIWNHYITYGGFDTTTEYLTFDEVFDTKFLGAELDEPTRDMYYNMLYDIYVDY
jgi:hypothetical protein